MGALYEKVAEIDAKTVPPKPPYATTPDGVPLFDQEFFEGDRILYIKGYPSVIVWILGAGDP
ncbi:MAG TPA: hypothetical protein VHE55_11475 [Fimbriimonadaceae bacterium]|nr:hypothetical protein [Fimbriimonadaceae bacterium]